MDVQMIIKKEWLKGLQNKLNMCAPKTSNGMHGHNNVEVSMYLPELTNVTARWS